MLSNRVRFYYICVRKQLLAMATFKFYLKDKQAKESLVILVVRRYVGGKEQRVNYSTKEKINPKYWLSTEQRVKKSYSQHNTFNARLNDIKERAKAAVQNLEGTGQPLTNAIIKNALDIEFNRKAETSYTVFTFITDYLPIDRYTERTDGTLRNYNQLGNILKEYQNFNGEPITWHCFTYDWYNRFKDFLISQKQYQTNTINKHTTRLKALLNLAHKKNLIKTTDFRDYKTKAVAVHSIALTETELQKIYMVELPKEYETSRDLFVLQSYIGVRYSDLKSITPESINGGYITIVTQKTNQRVTIPCNNIATEILNKYNNQLPKAPSNQQMNRDLKLIGEQAEINDPEIIVSEIAGKKITENKLRWQLITTHTARRSFATNAWRMGLPTLSIMAITGHKKESTFLSYIKVSQKEHAVRMRKIMLEHSAPLKIAK